MVSDLSFSGPFSDLWALGIICYQLYVGKTPWTNGNQLQVFDQIADPNTIDYPDSIPEEAQEFLKILLDSNPINRLGLNLKNKDDQIADDWAENNHLFQHKYFENIDITELNNSESY